MARRTIAGIVKSAVLGAALAGGVSMAAQADELELSATTALTTDYVFRGISQTNQKPAIQGSLDAAYGIFYAGVWGSNVDFANSLELDWYGGIASEWNGFAYDIGVIWYTYPGSNGTDLVEIKTGLGYTFGDSFTVGVTNYWGTDSDYDVLEVGGEYAFGQFMGFFDPSVSALVGFNWADGGTDYTYWNVGLTLGFLDNWAADIRYWDSDLNGFGCSGVVGGNANNCDSRVVGTISASF